MSRRFKCYQSQMPLIDASHGTQTDRDSEWYSPMQFVSSNYFPYFKSATEVNSPTGLSDPVGMLYTTDVTCSIEKDYTSIFSEISSNYVPNSCPSWEELQQCCPVPTLPLQQTQNFTKKRHVTPVDQKTYSYRKSIRTRIAFTTEQLNVLETEYKLNRYTNKFRNTMISQKLGLTVKNVKVWFQNRRMKEKNENLHFKEYQIRVY